MSTAKKRALLEPRAYPQHGFRTDFGNQPLQYETYKPTQIIPIRPGAMDAYKLPSLEFGKRKDV